EVESVHDGLQMEALTQLKRLGGTKIKREKGVVLPERVSLDDITIRQNTIRHRFRLWRVEADERRKIDSPRRGKKTEHVEPVPLHSIAETVIGLEIIRHRIAIAERVALVIVVRQIFGELIIHLELEALRHLLL